MVLLDTDIVIDVLRKFSPAMGWFSSLNQEIALPGYVAMELIQGCGTRFQQNKVERVVRRTKIVWLSPGGCDRALQLFFENRLRNDLGLLDSLIAETAIEADLPLHTFNVKHYRVVPNLELIHPYKK